jgi:predicted ATPase
MKSPYIKRLHLSNFLSFGPESEAVELGALNVLIGANGSGKSNFIEAIALLNQMPGDAARLIREGGGMEEWIWKGEGRREVAKIEAVVGVALGDTSQQAMRHVVELEVETSKNPRMYFRSEVIEDEQAEGEAGAPHFYFKSAPGAPPTVNLRDGGGQRSLIRENVSQNQSILSQIRDAFSYKEITWLSDFYESIQIYKDWSLGKNSLGRQLQRADLPPDRMLADASNLSLFLNHLRSNSAAKKKIIECLKAFYEGVEDFGVTVHSNTVQLYFEEGSYNTPSTRLSDGTMRFLFLAAILVDPTPPPVICIEEPELGLHPDSIVLLARLLVEASERTQLIVTTHSDVLVDALSATPEAILVCERYEEGTHIERLKIDSLGEFLKRYSLGNMWRSGHIGGNRW